MKFRIRELACLTLCTLDDLTFFQGRLKRSPHYKAFRVARGNTAQSGGRQDTHAVVQLYRAAAGNLCKHAKTDGDKGIEQEIADYVAYEIEEVLSGRWPEQPKRARAAAISPGVLKG